MQRQIDTFIEELEYKAPAIQAKKERPEFLEEQLAEMSVLLENSNNDYLLKIKAWKLRS